MGAKGEVEAERERGEHSGQTGGEGGGERPNRGPRCTPGAGSTKGRVRVEASAKLLAIFHKKKMGNHQLWEC